VLTSPAPGLVGAGSLSLTATATSPYVLFELSGSNGTVRRTPVAAVEGQFADTLPTAGLGPNFVAQARACLSVDVESCTTLSETVSLQRPVPKSVPTTTWPSVLDPTVTPSVSVEITNLGDQMATLTGPGGQQTVSDGQVVEIDLTAFADGDRLLSLDQCSPLGSTTCTHSARLLVVRRQPFVNAYGGDFLLNMDGDGYWESGTPLVQLDRAVDMTAEWSIKSGATLVAGPTPFTAQQLTQARTGGYGVGIQLTAQTIGTTLPAGDYWFEVKGTAVEPDFTKSATDRVAFHVATSPAITALTPNASVFYPRDDYPGVAHAVRVGPRLDPRVVKYGAGAFSVLDSNNQSIGWWVIDPADPVIRWDGWYYPPSGGAPVLAPAGTYRIQLEVSDDGEPRAGPVSAPFKLSHRYRVPIRKVVSHPAANTRIATLVQHNARVRAEDGSLLYRHAYRSRFDSAWVTTVHRVRVPLPDYSRPTLSLRGRWPDSWTTIHIVTPAGRVVPVQVYDVKNDRRMDVTIRPGWIRADRTLKFRLIWQGVAHGRTDRVNIARWTYAWRT